MNTHKRIVVGITGASGSIYAHNLLSKLSAINTIEEIALIATETGEQVWEYEMGTSIGEYPRVKRFSNTNLFAPPASGSAGYDAMVIIPCSAGTLSRIACGNGNDLLARSADVMLKERKPLILTFREAPYSLIHINNMQTITQAGGIILPASPSFYNHPKSIEDLIDSITNRVLDLLQLPHLGKRWGE